MSGLHVLLKLDLDATEAERIEYEKRICTAIKEALFGDGSPFGAVPFHVGLSDIDVAQPIPSVDGSVHELFEVRHKEPSGV